jgi:hypothetical protein
MAVQKSTTLRNALLDLNESHIGASPILEIRTGAQPANAAAASSGTLLVQMTLPSDYMAAASGGTKAKSGTWEDPVANATGSPGHWRLFDSGGTTCHMQGSASGPGGGGNLEVSAATITSGQPVTVSAFTWTEGNA